jgi:hypothetical protein
MVHLTQGAQEAQNLISYSELIIKFRCDLNSLSYDEMHSADLEAFDFQI